MNKIIKIGLPEEFWAEEEKAGRISCEMISWLDLSGYSLASCHSDMLFIQIWPMNYKKFPIRIVRK